VGASAALLITIIGFLRPNDHCDCEQIVPSDRLTRRDGAG
jgi:hypothetical protein